MLRAVPPDQKQRFVEAFHTGFAGAMNEIFVIAAIVAFVGALAGFLLVRHDDFVHAGERAPEAEAVAA